MKQRLPRLHSACHQAAHKLRRLKFRNSEAKGRGKGVRSIFRLALNLRSCARIRDSRIKISDLGVFLDTDPFDKLRTG